MERRSLFELAAVALMPGPSGREAVPVMTDAVRDDLIARYIDTPDGRRRLVEGAKWAVGRITEAQHFEKFRNILVRIMDRSRAGESHVPDLLACIDRCDAAT